MPAFFANECSKYFVHNPLAPEQKIVFPFPKTTYQEDRSGSMIFREYFGEDPGH